jgi:caa(3)-type oxidase subunit IV
VRTYWMTWALLLVLTVLMLWADGASRSIPRTAFVVAMLGAMLIKAALVGWNFMHLHAEHTGIVVTVVVGLFVTGTILFVLIAPDAARIHDMVGP